MYLILTLIACLAISFFFTWAAKKLRIPAVVGLIIAGLIIGIPFVKQTFIEPNTGFVLSLGNAGLIVLMFLAGMEVSWHVFYRERKKAFFIALFAALIPFALGLTIFLALGFSLLIALTVGICMAITAEAIKARVLLELKK